MQDNHSIFLSALTRRVDAFVSATRTAIEDCEPRVCGEYVGAFRQLSSKSEDGFRDSWLELSRIAEVHPYSDPDPRHYIPYKGLSLLDDITSERLDAWAEIACRINDPDLLARCVDIAWLRSRGRRRSKAELDVLHSAVRAQAAAAARCGLLAHYGQCNSRLLRALRFAKVLTNKDLYDEVINTCKKLLSGAAGRDHGGSSLRLMETLLTEKDQAAELADPCIEWSEAAVRVAEDDLKLNNEARYITHHRAQLYLEMKIKWMKIANILSSIPTECLRIAMHCKGTADYWEALNHPFQTASAIEDEISWLVQAGASQDTIDDAYRRLARHQQSSTKLLKRSSNQSEGVVNLTPSAQAIREAVADLPLPAALGVLLEVAQPPSEDDVRGYIRKARDQGLSAPPMPIRRISNDGRAVGYRSGQLDNDMSEYSVVVEHMRLCTSAIAAGTVLPGLRAIAHANYVGANDIDRLLRLSAFVPSTHRYAYVRGLLAGFEEDWIVVAHLLPPQIEHCLRLWLQLSGHITSELNRNVQHEFDLNAMLGKQEIIETIGPDVALELRATLTHQFGANLRNYMAHGLLEDHEYQTVEVAYLWWLGVRLALLWPTAKPKEAVAPEPVDQ